MCTVIIYFFFFFFTKDDQVYTGLNFFFFFEGCINSLIADIWHDLMAGHRIFFFFFEQDVSIDGHYENRNIFLDEPGNVHFAKTVFFFFFMAGLRPSGAIPWTFIKNPKTWNKISFKVRPSHLIFFFFSVQTLLARG